MLKRILAMVLSVVMVLSLMPTGAVAVETEHIHCMCGTTKTKDATCASCGTKAVVWTGIDKMPALNAPGNYYLTKNISADPVEYTAGEFAFCLCGHELHTGSAGKRIFGLKNTGTKLTITDCGTTGTITGATGATATGSLLRIGGGTEFNLYGGRITGNTASGNGVILVAETGTMNMYGGEISGNTSARGAIYVQDAGSKVCLLGGVITGNTGTNTGGMGGGAGVYGMKGVVELGGTIQIYGNTAASNEPNLYVRNDQGCSVQLSAVKPLENGTKVYYGTNPAGTEANNYGVTVSAAPANWSSSWLRYNGTKLAMTGTKLTLDTSADHVHCMCGKETADGKTCADCGTKAVEWIGTKTVPTADGYYYLTESVKTAQVDLKANVSLCLHGENLESAAGKTIVKLFPGSSFAVTDCSAQPGKLTGTTSACAVDIQPTAVFKLYNGKITGNVNSGNGIVWLGQGDATNIGGSFYMYGGEISGNKVGRGAVFATFPTNASHKTAVVQLLGGKITENEGTNTGGMGGGAGVYATSPVVIGGKMQIFGNTAKNEHHNLYLRDDNAVYSAGLVISEEKPLEDGANVIFTTNPAESDLTNLKSITGSPANWSNQWVKLGEDKVGYKDGKFLIDNSVPVEHIHCLCGAETTLDATCADCGSKAVKWTGTDKLPTKDEPGYYFLTGDVSTAEVNYANGGKFGICLNGHALKSAAGSQIFEVFEGATMDITDCGTTGTITGATGKSTYGSTLRVNRNATLTLWNGTITGNTAADEGIIYVDYSDDAAVPGATFIMYGGKITGNTVRRGAVYGVSTGLNGPTIKILGGEITGNTGTGTGVRKGGAGVYSFFPVEVGGTAKIYGNTAKEGPADLYVRNDGTYTGKVIVSAEKPLTDGADIQYALAAAEADATDLQFITGTPAVWNKAWVTYAGDPVDYADGTFFTKEAIKHIHCLCGAETTLGATCADCGSKAVGWTGIEQMPAVTEPGYYYLLKDVSVAPFFVNSGEFAFCLCGHTMTSAAGKRMFNLDGGSVISFTDCQDACGTITGSKGISEGGTNYGSTMRVNDGCFLNIYNGKIAGNSCDNEGVLYVTPGGTLTMYGGEVSGNTTGRGAIFGVAADGGKKSVIRILGGTVTGNTGTNTGGLGGGAGVYSFCDVEVGGDAKIFGNTAAAGNGDLYVRNTNGEKLIISAEKPLTDGANVNYAVASGEADPMNMQYITGAPTAWNMEWVKYEGVKVGYEAGRFYTKYALDYADHDHDNAKWVSVTQDNGQLPGADGYYVLEGDVKLDKLIIIGSNSHVRLCLNGHTLTAADKSAHFEVQDGGTLTVCDCTAKTVNGVYTAGKITGGNGKTGGSVRLRPGSQMELIDGIFTGNKCAEGGNGGVVYMDAATTDAPYSIFRMTGGQICGNTGVLGGAIRLGAATKGLQGPAFIMEGGSICHNESSNHGGAIHAAGGADVQLKGGVIENNTAVEGGGAISINSQSIEGNKAVNDTASVILSGTTIQNNSAGTWGGNIYAKSGTVVTMTGGIVAGGSSKVGAGILLESKGTQLHLSGGKITGNKAGAAGAGAVYASNGTLVSMTGGEITNNTSESSCGGITLYGAEGVLTGGKISDNYAKDSAGGLRIQGSEVYLGKVIISGNKTDGSSGGVYISRAGSLCSNVTIEGAQIINNTCVSSGGGIFLYMNGNHVTMESGLIAGNQAVSGAGVLAQREVSFTMNGGEIRDNKATGNGGGYYASIDSTFILNDGKISGNYAQKNGGGFYGLRSNITLKGGTIEKNTAKTTAGGVYISGSKATLSGTRVTGNKALEGSGGGVMVISTTQNVDGVPTRFPAKLTITGGVISYNTTPKAAAGLLLQSADTVVDMQGGTIANNTATKFSGGVYVGKGSTFNMYGGSVANNVSETDAAGGIRVDNGIANLTGGNVYGNKAAKSSGGVMCGGAEGKVFIGALKIYENEAKVGAGLLAQGKCEVTVDGAEIYRNKATQDAGGVYLSTYTKMTLKNTKIYENTAPVNGGGMWTWATSDAVLENCEFTNNTAGEQGGAVWTRGDSFIADGCTFTGNKAEKNNGGAIFAGMMGSATPRAVPCLHLYHTTFHQNEANGQGGALYVSAGAELTMDTVVFTENRANAEAGAFWAKDEVTMHNITATGNQSGGEGFAVYLADGDYDGQTFFYGLMKISGDMIICDNRGGDLYLGETTPMVVGEKGLGKDTKIQLTLHSGYLTQWVWGSYNYEGGDRNYTITYGDRSLTDPEEIPETQQNMQSGTDAGEGGNTVLYVGVGVFAAAVIAALVLILLKKNKKTAKEAVQE